MAAYCCFHGVLPFDDGSLLLFSWSVTIWWWQLTAVFRECYHLMTTVYCCFQGALPFDDGSLLLFSGSVTIWWWKLTAVFRECYHLMMAAYCCFQGVLPFDDGSLLLFSGSVTIWWRQFEAATREGEERHLSHSTFCSTRLPKLATWYGRSGPRETLNSKSYGLFFHSSLLCFIYYNLKYVWWFVLLFLTLFYLFYLPVCGIANFFSFFKLLPVLL